MIQSPDAPLVERAFVYLKDLTGIVAFRWLARAEMDHWNQDTWCVLFDFINLRYFHFLALIFAASLGLRMARTAIDGIVISQPAIDLYE